MSNSDDAAEITDRLLKTSIEVFQETYFGLIQRALLAAEALEPLAEAKTYVITPAPTPDEKPIYLKDTLRELKGALGMLMGMNSKAPEGISWTTATNKTVFKDGAECVQWFNKVSDRLLRCSRELAPQTADAPESKAEKQAAALSETLGTLADSWDKRSYLSTLGQALAAKEQDLRNAYIAKLPVPEPIQPRLLAPGLEPAAITGRIQRLIDKSKHIGHQMSKDANALAFKPADGLSQLLWIELDVALKAIAAGDESLLRKEGIYENRNQFIGWLNKHFLNSSSPLCDRVALEKEGRRDRHLISKGPMQQIYEDLMILRDELKGVFPSGPSATITFTGAPAGAGSTASQAI